MADLPRENYHLLRARLLLQRAQNGFSEGEEDALLDEMDSVWWSMTEADREQMDATLPAARREAQMVVAAVSVIYRLSVEHHRELVALQRELPSPRMDNAVQREALERFRGRKPPEYRP